MIDLAKEAAKLAALIGERTPHIGGTEDLLAYAEHVRETIRDRAFWDEQEIDDLRLRLDPEGCLREMALGNAGMQRLMNRKAGLKAKQAAGAGKSRRRGQETRKAILCELALLTGRPARERAGLIAHRLAMPESTVRHWLRLIAKDDQ
jgi:hypothetical protein